MTFPPLLLRAWVPMIKILASLAVLAATALPAGPAQGQWGPAELVKSDAVADDLGPVVSLPGGDTLTLWTDRAAHLRASFRDIGDGTWAAATDVSGSGTYVWAHKVVDDPSGRVITYWQGTKAGQAAIWSREFQDGTWGATNLEFTTEGNYIDLEVAVAGNVQAVLWLDPNPRTRVSTKRGNGGWVTLPVLPTAKQFVFGLSVDTQGRPTVIGTDHGRVLATTYQADGTWSEERLGPSAGYELEGSIVQLAEAATSVSGAVAVGWFEVPVGSGSEAEGRTVVRYRAPGGTFGARHTLSTDAKSCYEVCQTLGLANDGDLVAVYARPVAERDADLWLVRRDAATGAWSNPQLIAQAVSRYLPWEFAVGPGGAAVVAADGDSKVVVRCPPVAACPPARRFSAPRLYADIVVDAGPLQTSSMMLGVGCVTEGCWARTLRARVAS